MSIFIILRLVQCTCFALYVLWNKWSTVMIKLVVFISNQVDIERQQAFVYVTVASSFQFFFC